MYKYLFGPVASRRLGLSLGIDLVPHKVCSLNCVYCECGATTGLTTERQEYVPTAEVLDELNHFLNHHPVPDILTFSGAGEPTLHKDFGFIIKTIREKYPSIPVAVLTNAISLAGSAIGNEMLQASVVLPSLDAVSEPVFKKINRPAKGIEIRKVIEGLVSFRKAFKGEIRLEILIIPGYNDKQDELEKFKLVLPRIKADKIQLNTLDRPGTLSGLRTASRLELKSIREFLGFDNIEIVAKWKIKNQQSQNQGLTERIADTLSRRPCTLEDLTEMFGISENEATEALDTLDEKGKIEVSRQERGVFYRLLR